MPRDLALAALNSQNLSPGFHERYLEKAFKEMPHLNERDRAFTLHMVQGVLRWQIRLDWVVKETVRFPFGKIQPPILNILRLALYQIFFMDRVPDSAAVNEAVKQAKVFGYNHVKGFVNGILRNICRHKGRITFPDRDSDRARYLSLVYSYPIWLVRKWTMEMGAEEAERLLDAGNRLPNLVIRTNTLKTERGRLIEILNDEGVNAIPLPYSPEGIAFDGFKGTVNRLKAFREGLFQVQGEAAQICSHLALPQPGESVLDLCAGLGGKSTHLAALMGDRGLILALDRNHFRLTNLLKSSMRLGIGSLYPVVADATAPVSSFLRHTFDSILIDGPCSGLGVISRHPDTKLAKGEGDIKRLALLQSRMLNRAVPLLKTGGRMLYVTCTISREENEGVVESFLKGNSEMAPMNLKDYCPEWGLDLIDDNGFFKAFPHVHGMEGFFGALFRKAWP